MSSKSSIAKANNVTFHAIITSFNKSVENFIDLVYEEVHGLDKTKYTKTFFYEMYGKSVIGEKGEKEESENEQDENNDKNNDENNDNENTNETNEINNKNLYKVLTELNPAFKIKQKTKFQEHVLSSILGQTIMFCYVHPVTFEFILRDNFDLETDIIMENISEYKLDENSENKLENILEEIHWNTIINPEWTNLKITTDEIGNDDSRGGGCGNLKLKLEEFVWTQSNPTGLTIRNLTEAVYRMKGSKYDWWYELYSGTTFEINENKLVMNVSFGYGS